VCYVGVYVCGIGMTENLAQQQSVTLCQRILISDSKGQGSGSMLGLGSRRRVASP